MILQQRPDQLAAVRFQTRLQLRVLKPGACSPHTQPANAQTSSPERENPSGAPGPLNTPSPPGAARRSAPCDGVNGSSLTGA